MLSVSLYVIFIYHDFFIKNKTKSVKTLFFISRTILLDFYKLRFQDLFSFEQMLRILFLFRYPDETRFDYNELSPRGTPRRSKTSCSTFVTSSYPTSFPTFSTSVSASSYQTFPSSVSAPSNQTSFPTFSTTNCPTFQATSTSHIGDAPDFDERREVFPILTQKNGNGISRLEILMEESGSPDLNGFCQMRLPDIGSNQKV